MPYDHVQNRPVSVALVQMSCTEAKQPNVEKARRPDRRGGRPRGEHRLPAGAVYRAITSARPRTTAGSPRPSRFPARRARPWPPRRRSTAWWSSARCSSGGPRASITTRRSSSTPTARRRACIARCTSRTTRCTTRNSTSRPATWAFRAFRRKFGKVGVCVCWDQWYPEAARLTALTGAEILFYPTAIGWLPDEKEEFGASQHNAWETMMRSHAIANGVFVAAPNRVGREGALQFWGGSFVSDPNGNLLAKGQHDRRRDRCMAECDLGLIDVVRTHWPFFRDRRIDAYGDLTKRYRDAPLAGTKPGPGEPWCVRG